MSTKPLVASLGASSNDRVVVLHADDIGMCEATVSAYRDIAARGILSSASAMVPCGWFPSVARVCRESSGPRDMGVHLTLTSEWSDYRWGPLSGEGAAGLCDDQGYFPRRAEDVQRAADLRAVDRELRLQVARAKASGVDVTHLDSHMLTLMAPDLLRVHARLSREIHAPCCVLGPDDTGDFVHRSPPLRALEQVAEEDRRALVVFDAWAELPLRVPKGSVTERLEMGKRILEGLPAGLSYFLSHPAVDGPELRAIAPDWEARVADYRLYLDDRWARALEAAGVKVVGMRAIRDVLFKES